ncbi:MAG: hypothetical protein MI864_06300 [Pseudomonadales bacterium]|nr:hypothetical protein [Pseudomonadales bacterium]
MKVKYIFKFDSGSDLTYDVDPDRADLEDEESAGAAPEWALLSHCQCSNCPMKASEVKYCPAALDIKQVVEDFRSQPAFQKVDVSVVVAERSYQKRTGIEEGLRSLLGLILATSRCPILSQLKPMAVHHMPFSSNDEFILRSVSIYLLQQYFNHRAGDAPDWELKGLVERNKQLQLVNQALWQRIHTACESDSNLKALLSFFSMSSSVSFSLESQLQKLRNALEGEQSN